MARYSGLLGRRVEVHYRSGDVIMPVTGTLAADSGKSIFLQEIFQDGERVRSFRWEIFYRSIVNIVESSSRVDVSALPAALPHP